MLLWMIGLFGCRSEKGVTIFNPSPEAEITSHVEGEQVLEGTDVLFIGNVNDANHSAEELRTTWSYGDQEICVDVVPDIDGTTSCSISIAEDSVVELEVQDTDNARDSDMRTLLIVPSQPPITHIVRPDANGVFYSDQKITLEGVVSDLEDDLSLLMVQWVSDIDGLLSVAQTPDSLGNVVGASYFSEGEHFLVLQAEDSSGKIGFDDVTIRVGPPNTPPECAIISPHDGASGGSGTLVSFLGSASDINVPSSLLEASWSSSLDGALGGASIDSDGSILFPYSDLSSGTHVLTLSVLDERAAACTDSIVYTVGTPPTVDITTPVEGFIFHEGELANFSVLVMDEQDEATTIDLEWMLNGSFYSTQGAISNGVASIQDSTLAAGSYSLQVVATDSEQLTSSAIRNFTINGLPTVPEISIAPQFPTTSSDLTVQIDIPSVDPEGQSVSYIYEWFQNGVSQGIGASQIQAVDTSVGDIWTVHVTPNDGLGQGDFAQLSVEIMNTEPSILGHQITPNTAVYNDSLLNCTASVIDADESLNANYSWFGNGVLLSSGAAIDLGTYSVSVGDSVLCRAQATDTQGASISSDLSLVVENRIPVIDVITMSPHIAYTDTVVSVVSQGSDQDAENVLLSYDWYVNSTMIQSGSNASLDGNVYFSKGDDVFVRVIPSDVHGQGTAQDSAIWTIENTSPQPPTVAFFDGNGAIVSGPVQTDEELQCGLTTPAFDLDGDVLSYSFSWSVGGVLWTGNTISNQYSDDAIASLDTQTGEEWSCMVEAFDGQSSSPVAQVSIDIGAQFVWEEVGTDTVEFAYGSCGNTYTNTVTCSSSYVGEKIYVHTAEYMGSKRLQYKLIGQQVHHGSLLMDVPGARGYAASISTDETQISWTGAVDCGADSIVTRSATLYECVEY